MQQLMFGQFPLPFGQGKTMRCVQYFFKALSNCAD